MLLNYTVVVLKFYKLAKVKSFVKPSFVSVSVFSTK